MNPFDPRLVYSHTNKDTDQMIYIGANAKGQIRIEVWTRGGRLIRGELITAEMAIALMDCLGLFVVETFLNDLDEMKW